MKQDDFERLKVVCEREGFEINRPFDEGMVVVKKKDPWENVEFVECIESFRYGCYTNGKIYPLKKIVGDTIQTTVDDDGNFNGWNKKFFKPSTESAYIDQLKKEAFEKLGPELNRFKIDSSNMDGGEIQFSYEVGRKTPFKYTKDTDTLYWAGIPIYQQGKWAERVKERVEITFVRSYNSSDDICYFGFRHNTDGKFYDVGQFLASQLEKYLNGEIE